MTQFVNRIRKVWPLVASALLSGCMNAAKPRDLTAIQDFDTASYLGTWHEIARLDHVFERGLDHCRAEYSLRADGRIRVVNSGSDAKTGAAKSITGAARQAGAANEGRLSVTFFWPFAGGYNILAWRREAPSYALVCGNTKDYFWILARDKSLPPETLQTILPQIQAWGIATNRLIWVKQD